MKEYSQQSTQQSSEQSSNSSASNSASTSNSDQASLIANGTSSLADAFALIAAGSLAAAKDVSHQLATQARTINDNQTVQWAGNIWTIANSLGEIQQKINNKTFDGVKELASTAADLTRSLMSTGVISQGSGESVAKSAGGYWTMANEASKQNNSNSSGAAATAANSETVDQHKLSASRGWAYCGIATSLMMLYANGKGDKNNVSAERDQLVSEMYNSGVGTDVDQMATSMRKRGLKNSTSTRNGTMTQLLDSLDGGQPVPFGITHMKGTIVKINSAGSKNHPYKRVGDRHERGYGSSGHWVLVVGYEGNRDNPSHFLINDPDLGGQVKATRSELETMGVGNGQFFQVYQKK